MRPGRGKWLLLAVVTALAAAGTLLSCATNPATGGRIFTLVSEEKENAMGKEADPAIRAEYGVYDDAELAAHVQRMGMKLARRSERPELDWHFTVLDSPVVNAFALPGGYIYVTRGLLAHANSEAQLAGVLGHEIGHVTARHSAQQMSRQQALGIGLGVGAVFSETAARFSDLTQMGAGLLLLKNSRSHESQSDELGIRYMTRAGYDPRELPAFFDVLDRLQTRAGGAGIPNWLATHPAPENRVEATQALAKQRVQGRADRASLEVGRESYLELLDGMVFGEDPRQGFFEENVYYHPEMRFTLTYPPGWVTLNRPTQVVAGDDAERTTALLRMTLGRGREGEGPAAYLRRQVAEASSASLASLDEEMVHGFPAALARVTIHADDGSRRTVFLAAVAKDGAMFDFLGQTVPDRFGDHEPVFRKVVRSFADLTDRARLSVQPRRVTIRPVPRAGSFDDYLASQGSQGLEPQELAILNQLRRRDSVEAGHLVKVVE